MPHADASNNRTPSIPARTVGLVLTAVCLCGTATAQEVLRSARSVTVAPEQTLTGLEKAFWSCDYSATMLGVVDAGTAIPCGISTEALRVRKFNGDFNAMLSWWKQNKAGEHQVLDRAYRAAVHR